MPPWSIDCGESYDGQQQLHYCGNVGTGFDETALRELKAKLDELSIKASPFVKVPREVLRLGVTWSRPKLVAEIEFTEWTDDDRLRHPSFQGLRADKRAAEVVRERTVRQLESTEQKKRDAQDKPPVRRPVKTSPSGLKRPRHESANVAGVSITHPDRIWYPGTSITKADVARYYESIDDWVLPYVVDRPLTLLRCPEGFGGECFFHKHWKPMMADAVVQVPLAEKSKEAVYVAIQDLRGLVSLVQISVLEIHPWGAKRDDTERPDQIIFDLDPGPDVRWKEVIQAARDLRSLGHELDLESFVRTSGGKGLHVVIPIQRRNTWEEVETFAENIAKGLSRHAPDRFVANMRKDLRQGKIFVDYLRNQRGSTSVASYSTRNRAGAPVAAPVAWEELDKVTAPDQFTITNLPERLAKLRRDPWKNFFRVRQNLSKKLLQAAERFA